VQYEYTEICAAIEEEEKSHRTEYMDFFRTSGNRHRLGVLLAIAWGQNWIGNGLISYYLSPILATIGITNPAQTTGINGGLQIWNLFFALLGSSMVERLGRRPLWLTSTAGMFVSNICIMGLSAGFAQTKDKVIGTAVM
jgi:MFS family permease